MFLQSKLSERQISTGALFRSSSVSVSRHQAAKPETRLRSSVDKGFRRPDLPTCPTKDHNFGLPLAMILRTARLTTILARKKSAIAVGRFQPDNLGAQQFAPIIINASIRSTKVLAPQRVYASRARSKNGVAVCELPRKR